jgi:adenine phosphoribosyltransferase
VDVVACIDARGFIIGAALAQAGFRCGPYKKKGKLPWQVYSKTYDLEYGQDIEIHQTLSYLVKRVLIVDDVLATGGTALAVVSMVKEMKGELVGAAFLMELKTLKGEKS